MSDRIIIAKRAHTCDLCGQRISPGSWCRIIKDDFMPGIYYFEHLRCPSAAAKAVRPNKPVVTKHTFIFA